MTVYSRRFLQSLALVVGTPATYTVPAGKTLVVKDVDCRWISGTTADCVIAIAGTAYITMVRTATGTPAAHWEGGHVLNAAEQLTASMLVGSASVIISGFLLDAL